MKWSWHTWLDDKKMESHTTFDRMVVARHGGKTKMSLFENVHPVLKNKSAQTDLFTIILIINLPLLKELNEIMDL